MCLCKCAAILCNAMILILSFFVLAITFVWACLREESRLENGVLKNYLNHIARNITYENANVFELIVLLCTDQFIPGGRCDWCPIKSKKVAKKWIEWHNPATPQMRHRRVNYVCHGCLNRVESRIIIIKKRCAVRSSKQKK